MSKIDLEKAKGCKHCPGERPIYRNCINCGSPICYECVIEDAISQKVTGRSFGAGFGSSGDSTVGAVGSSTSTSMSYVTFCPACYLKNISDPSYMILTGSSFKRNAKISPHKKPKFFGDIVNVLMVFPLSLVTYYITLVIRIITYRAEKQSYERYIENKQKAERALGIMPIAIQPQYQPSQPLPQYQQKQPEIVASTKSTQEFFYCVKCGQQNSAKVNFCVTCGTKLQK